MSITRLQQARQMYAMGQRVAKTLDGSRPGYRGSSYGSPSRSSSSGPAGGASAGGNYGGNKNTSQSYGGSGSTARERGIERNQTQRTPTKPTTRTGPTNIHGDGGGTTPYTYIGGKKYDVTPTTRNERDRAQLKQQIMNQTKLGGNRIDKFGNTKKSPFRQGNLLSSLLMSGIGMLMGIPGLGLLTGGLGSLGNKLGDTFGNFNRKMRGVNKDGTTRTQAQYEQARYNKSQQKRLDKLFAAKDRGYNQIGFGDFTKKTMDFTPGQQAKIDELMATGFMPSTARNVDSGRGSNLRGDINNLESIVAASTQPGFTDQATVYDPYGINVEDGRFSYDMNKTSVDDFNNQGILGIDVGYPSNDLMAKVSNQDLARYSQQGDLTRATDYETAMDTIYQGSQMTPYEFDQLQKGNITQPGTYIG
jgi:hypothetical protein